MSCRLGGEEKMLMSRNDSGARLGVGRIGAGVNAIFPAGLVLEVERGCGIS